MHGCLIVAPPYCHCAKALSCTAREWGRHTSLSVVDTVRPDISTSFTDIRPTKNRVFLLFKHVVVFSLHANHSLCVCDFFEEGEWWMRVAVYFSGLPPHVNPIDFRPLVKSNDV